jgi:hypothetical protein
MRTLYNLSLARQTIAPADHTATVTGSTVDRMTDEGGFRNALLIVNAGTVTDGTHTFTLQESDDDSTWSAVADEHLQGSEPALTSANDAQVHEVGYVGHKRYLRAVATVTGSPATGGLYGAVIQLGFPRSTPTR